MQAMHSTKNILFVSLALFILCLIYACHNNESKSLIDGIEVPSDTVRKSNFLSRAELISIFDSEMSKCNEIRWTDAFTGKESSQSYRYRWFSNWATNDELKTLIDSKNTITRVYAFLALENRNFTNLKSITIDHLQDTSSFVETYGCIGNTKRINEYFLEKSIGLFTTSEILKYRNLVSELSLPLYSNF